MSTVLQRYYEFGPFRMDPEARRLFCEDREVPLTSKNFDILLALIENPGRTLDKDELMQRVWADTFVEEGNLNRNISMLRKALGDDGRLQRFIRTIPKQGYRFTAPVREVQTETADDAVSGISLRVWEETVESGTVFPRVAVVSVVTVGLLAAVLLASAWFFNSDPATPARSGTTNSEAAEAYESGRALWQTRSATDLHQATVLLEKAVRLDPQFAAAHAALADAYAFDYRNWPKAEAAAREAIRLDPTLGEPHATIGFVRLFWEWKLPEAERELEQAVLLSPDYATGHQWYAISLIATGTAGAGALVEMRRALELAPDSPAINADLCQVLYFLNRYGEAVEQCNAALAVDPNFYNAHYYLYEIHATTGSYDEAISAYLRTEELNPQSPASGVREGLMAAYQTKGIRSFWQERLKQGTTEYRRAKLHARLGEKETAIDRLEKAYEAHEFEFVLMAVDPAFHELRDHPRFLALKNSLQIGNSP